MFVLCVSYVYVYVSCCIFFFFKQKTAYEMRISDWSSDVCSSDLQCNRTLGFLALSRCNAAGQKIFGQKTGYGRRAPAQNRESAARAPPHTGYALIFQQPHSPQHRFAP